VKETVNGNAVTVTFDDGSEKVFTGLLRMGPNHIGRPLPVNKAGTGIAIAMVVRDDIIEAWYVFGEESMDGFLNYLHITSDGEHAPAVSMYAPHGHISVTTLGKG
jgi:hypothetical protein